MPIEIEFIYTLFGETLQKWKEENIGLQEASHFIQKRGEKMAESDRKKMRLIHNLRQESREIIALVAPGISY